MSINIAINGFGRIGRTFLRTVFLSPEALKKINIVAINLGPCRPANLDILFQFDSIMGKFPGTVVENDSELVINGHAIKLFTECDPEALPWKQLNIDWVVEASGCFTDGLEAKKHCLAGSKRVLITAPASNDDVTIIPGVNDDAFDKQKHMIVSLGSCTTNCFAPVVKVLQESFGITSGLMTTTHAYTNDQVLLDVEHHDPRRARAAAINMVPTKTGADKVITKLFPELAGSIHAQAVRVPVPIVSLLDFTFVTKKQLTKEAINEAFEKSSKEKLKNIMVYETRPLVSSDFIGNEASCIFDSLLTTCTPNLGKVFAWYDNEYGYSCRLRDFLLHNS